MQMKYFQNEFLAVILLFSVVPLVSAQDNLSDVERVPGTIVEREYNTNLDAMPEGFASDFPLYSTTVAFAQYTKRPDEKEINDIRIKIESGKLPADYSISNLKIYRALSIQHRYTGASPADIRKWYGLNAFNAGYTEVSSEEGAMMENYHVRFEKKEDNILKRVILDIYPAKIDVTVFEDTQIQEHSDYISKPSTVPSEAGQIMERENN